MAEKYVYFFGEGKAEGSEEMRNLLGGKGAGLAEMTNLGIPVPAGFTITTEVCTYYFQHNSQYPPELRDQVQKALTRVERCMGARFGDPNNPLLLSVRSGARVSMPGMMDTVLNLGLNPDTVEGLARRSQNPRFSWDSYRRFIQMFSNVVMGLSGHVLESILEEYKKKKKAAKDTDLSTEDLKTLVQLYRERLRKEGKEFPLEPLDQLWGGIGAVFDSWNIPRAITYRKLNHIPEDWGTATNVQSMVFGNRGDDSATGVAFTRDPATGEKRFFGEWLPNAQGEDVVAGIRTPYPINNENKKRPEELSLEEHMPGCYNQLVRIYNRLEKHYRDMQDIEFTIQNGKLWMLQTRSGKRTGFAAVRMAVEMTEEGLISKEEAIKRVEPEALIQLLAPIFDAAEKKKAANAGRLLTKALNAGPGAACGRIVFSAEEAGKQAVKGPVLLVRLETSPDDIHGMAVARGILTARGGMTSHAALVARQMGRPCVVGAGALEISYAKKQMTVKGKVLKQGDWLSMDGTTGEVLAGQLPTYPSEVVQVLIEKKLPAAKSKVFQNFEKILAWADEFRTLGVRCNADTPRQALEGLKFGAAGIGLCRTEHMFFEGKRIDAVREMILAEDAEGRKRALSKILPMQKGDFIGIYKEMPGLPITIRLLDPPLHEFLPHTDKEIRELARRMKVKPEKLKAKVVQLHEFNPMLGLRGCRLGIVFPEIYDLQVQAIMEAACEVSKSAKQPVTPEIMIPLVGHVKELAYLRERTEKIAQEVMARSKIELKYLVGTMVEIPRAAVTADQVATVAEFFSYGTNDLTQTALGMSRDDAGSFLPAYVEKGIYKRDPFEAIDQEGVGLLMKIGVEKGRATRPELKVGICGEHGGEASSVMFCHRIGLDYVSCSPYRVPVARMAAAHVALQEREEQAALEEAMKKAKREAKKEARREAKKEKLEGAAEAPAAATPKKAPPLGAKVIKLPTRPIKPTAPFAAKAARQHAVSKIAQPATPKVIKAPAKKAAKPVAKQVAKAPVKKAAKPVAKIVAKAPAKKAVKKTIQKAAKPVAKAPAKKAIKKPAPKKAQPVKKTPAQKAVKKPAAKKVVKKAVKKAAASGRPGEEKK